MVLPNKYITNREFVSNHLVSFRSATATHYTWTYTPTMKGVRLLDIAKRREAGKLGKRRISFHYSQQKIRISGFEFVYGLIVPKKVRTGLIGRGGLECEPLELRKGEPVT